MDLKLTQGERLFVALIYTILLVGIYIFIGGSFDFLLGVKSNDNIIWFFSGALTILMGSYLVEPYFTKPSDAIANSVAVLISLLGINNKMAFFAYDVVFYYASIILILGIVAIATRTASRDWIQKTGKVSYWIVESFGSAKFIFSVVYLAASYSYFNKPEETTSLIIVISFWVILTFFDIIGLSVKRAEKLLNLFSTFSGEELGTAIGCENPYLYRVEMNLRQNQKNANLKYASLVAIETSLNIGSVGMVIDKTHLVSKKWLSVYLLRNEVGEIITIDLKSRKFSSSPKSIFSNDNSVFTLNYDSLSQSEQNTISANPLYKNKDNFVGYVEMGSNINTITFSLLRSDEVDQKISEGSILTASIYGTETLYQVINGSTKEEHLENFDKHGFVIGTARKLGAYDNINKSLETSRWVPAIYSPVFLVHGETFTAEEKAEMIPRSIGRLPGTKLEIPIKDLPSLVTHNTAVLGILGIGKSCLTFELIKKVHAGTEAKIICFDVTGEYADALRSYGCSSTTLDSARIETELTANYTAINKDAHRGGNHAHFRAIVTTLLTEFFTQTANKILTINPEEYDVSKQTNEIKAKKIGTGPNDWQDQAPMADLSVVEKVRIITEIVLEYSKVTGRTTDARYLLVFEEAHSLVPEWNSVANDGDKNAVNGISKVILQGRKYGLGSFIITQRTANVSKNVLNQCNTIFALRIFDDTGKDFLANYIGGDYADSLATLEERHAIAIGKGLRLKQPVIVQLNDRTDLTTAVISTNDEQIII